MNSTILDTKAIGVFRETLYTDDDNILTNTTACIQKTKKSIDKQVSVPPPGFMTGDEFERRVKERVTNFYKENGLL